MRMFIRARLNYMSFVIYRKSHLCIFVGWNCVISGELFGLHGKHLRNFLATLNLLVLSRPCISFFTFTLFSFAIVSLIYVPFCCFVCFISCSKGFLHITRLGIVLENIFTRFETASRAHHRLPFLIRNVNDVWPYEACKLGGSLSSSFIVKRWTLFILSSCMFIYRGSYIFRFFVTTSEP